MSVLANMVAQAERTHFATATTAQLVLGRTARRDPALHATLTARPDLCEAAWIELWERSTTQRHRLALAARPLSTACSELAIADRRPSVLTALLDHNPSTELAIRVPVKLISGKLADQIARCSVAPFEVRLDAASKASLEAQLSFVASPAGSAVDDDTIVAWFAAAGERVSGNTRSLTHILLESRPHLVGRLLGRRVWLTQVISGSIAITAEHLDAVLADALADQYALFALVSNPVVDPSVVIAALAASPWRTEVERLAVMRTGRPALRYPLTETTPATIEWLIRRCQVSDTRPVGRPLEALALCTAASDDVQRATLRTVFECASRWPVWAEVAARGFAALGLTPGAAEPSDDVDTHRTDTDPTAILTTHPRFVPGAALMRLAVDAFGDDLAAWENFASLAEEFDGPLGQLFEVARALA